MKETKRIFSALIFLLFAISVNAKGISMILVENHDKISDCKKARIGSIIKTTGYYINGDEGDAEYSVIVDDGTYTIDGDFIIKLRNGLLAKMNARDGYINIKSFGCKTKREKSGYDNTDAFQKVVDIATSYSYAVLVPVGDFILNGTVYLPHGAKILGYHGYTFHELSRLIQTVQPKSEEDNLIMFKGVNNDAIRHVTVDGVTFIRDRTKEERAIYDEGSGYGLKSTVFGPSTELSLTNCGFVGWGHCYSSAAILFSIRTDYAHCDNIIYSKTAHSSSVVIQDANIWCCGHLVKIKDFACSSIIFSNCWMEGLQTLLLAENSARMENLSFSGCTISPMSYGANNYLIQYPQKPSWNVVLVNFHQSLVRVPGYISTDLTPMSYKINFSDCSVHYYGDGEKILFDGNSSFWEGEKDKRSNNIRLRGGN